MSKMTEEAAARLRELWPGALTERQIAEELRIGESTLRKHAKRMGLSRRRSSPPLTDEQKQTIVRMWSEGGRVMQIARFVGCHHNKIRDTVNLYGNAPGCSARLAERPGRPMTPLPLAGRMTPQAQMRGCQTTHLLKSARKRQSIPLGPPPRKCQYPTGERPYTFCLAPVVPGRPYCCEHTARCYVKGKPLLVVPAKPKEPFVEFKW